MENVTATVNEMAAGLTAGLLPVSTLYIGFNVLITLFLSIMVVRARVQTGTEFGDGGSEELIKAQRVHGNNVEYVPLTLIAIATVELAGAPVWAIHVLGIALTFARLAHAAGLSSSTGRSIGRGVGAMVTWLVMLIAGGACIYYAVT